MADVRDGETFQQNLERRMWESEERFAESGRLEVEIRQRLGSIS